MRFAEHEEQKAIITWARLWQRKESYECLKYLHSSQNGEKFRNARQGARAKQAGLIAGVPDLFLPYPSQNYHGLFIELKRRIIKGQSRPVVSSEQKDFLDYLNGVGYKAIVCYGSDEAINAIKDYLAPIQTITTNIQNINSPFVSNPFASPF